MDDKYSSGLILLTYKNKALLMYKYESSIDEKEHEWSLIKGFRKTNESLKQALIRIVLKETGIRIEKIKYLDTNLYHAELTDHDVNNIKRDEFQLLNFFTLKEVKELILTPSTKQFVTQYGSLI